MINAIGSYMSDWIIRIKRYDIKHMIQKFSSRPVTIPIINENVCVNNKETQWTTLLITTDIVGALAYY